MVSISCCNVGASPPSCPNGTCLVFLISVCKLEPECGWNQVLAGPTVGAKCSRQLTGSPIDFRLNAPSGSTSFGAKSKPPSCTRIRLH